MNIFSQLRVVVLLRRIARALEAANELSRDRLALEYPEWTRTHPKHRPRRTKLVEVGVADVADWNKKWDEEHEQPEE